MEGNLASLSALVTFLIPVTKSGYFSGTFDGLRADYLSYLYSLGTFIISETTSLSVLGNFLITGTTFFLGVKFSDVTLFDDINREELQYMPGDERSISLGV